MPRGDKPRVEPFLLRTREAATFLGVSQSQISIWTRSGVLNAIRIPGIRAVRYAREDVEALARQWRHAASEAAPADPVIPEAAR